MAVEQQTKAYGRTFEGVADFGPKIGQISIFFNETKLDLKVRLAHLPLLSVGISPSEIRTWNL